MTYNSVTKFVKFRDFRDYMESEPIHNQVTDEIYQKNTKREQDIDIYLGEIGQLLPSYKRDLFSIVENNKKLKKLKTKYYIRFLLIWNAAMKTNYALDLSNMWYLMNWFIIINLVLNF